MASPHALVIPYPAQGHVAPLMELSHRLAELGVLVTFVNTEIRHADVIAALPENFCSDYEGRIRLVAISDGAANDDDRRDRSRFFDVIQRSMPSFLEDLILKINEREDNEITSVIVDGLAGFLLAVPEKLNIQRAAFWPSSAWQLAILRDIPKLLDTGIMDHNGFIKSGKLVQLFEGVPAINPDHLPWVHYGDTKRQASLFKYLSNCFHHVRGVDHVLCNSFLELELPVFNHLNCAVPVGPLVSANRTGHQPSSLWAEDLSCVAWLDQQPVGSVIYVSFGSLTVLNQHQIRELALGLELSDRPFLWVCRPDLMDGSTAVYPDGFLDRVLSRGLIVRCAPQKEVLSHPSVACFLTHCGWNSTVEGVSNGVPMLCWPYFSDQFQNQAYIVELWRVGLKLAYVDEGIVRKEEIMKKLEALINDEGIRERVLELKDKGRKAILKDGVSAKNLEGFVCTMKEEPIL